uniref:Uncharacterized protein n=1 Tax=Parascaris equorum TaxID=6256 RepID=A0A914S541_PAREQ
MGTNSFNHLNQKAVMPASGYGGEPLLKAPAVEEEALKAIEQPTPAEGPAEVEAKVPELEEQAVNAVEQPTPAEGPAEVEVSGYRKKRNNEYGDEPVVQSAESEPAGGYGGEPFRGAEAVEEEAPKAIEQPTLLEGPTEVEASGYRKKRNNEYGDEPLAQ